MPPCPSDWRRDSVSDLAAEYADIDPAAFEAAALYARTYPLKGPAAPAAPAGRVKLWIDEDLSPLAGGGLPRGGLSGDEWRDRGKLSTKDHALAKIVLDEGCVLVTNNAGDFLKLVASAGLHPGLVFIELGSAQQERDWLAAGIAHIESRAVAAEESAEESMVNRVVEVDENGGCSDYAWP